MSGYAVSYLTGSPWLGVAVAGFSGILFGALHGAICSLPKVNDIAVGIALMVLGTGIAFFLGKPFIQPKALHLPAIELGWWSSSEQVRTALRINVLFLIGVVLAPALLWGFKNTRWGLVVRMAGDSADAALAMGYSVRLIRLVSTACGGFFGWCWGRLLVALLPRELERGIIKRSGVDGCRFGNFCALESGKVFLCFTPVWWRRCSGARATIGWHYRRLLPIQRGPLRAHSGDYDLHQLTTPHIGRRA